MVKPYQRFLRRRRRTRHALRQKASGRPRLSVFRSNQHIYAQLIDDGAGRTLVAASTIEKELREGLRSTGDRAAAKRVGQVLAERAKAAGLDAVVFDRGAYRYHGRVAALAEGAREGGLSF